MNRGVRWEQFQGRGGVLSSCSWWGGLLSQTLGQRQKGRAVCVCVAWRPPGCNASAGSFWCVKGAGSVLQSCWSIHREGMRSPSIKQAERGCVSQTGRSSWVPPAVLFLQGPRCLLHAQCAAKPNLCKIKLHFIAQFSSALPFYVLGLNCQNFAASCHDLLC